MLCVSDLFEPVGDVPYFDRDRVVAGSEFFAVLSRPSFKQRIRYWRRQPNAELLYLHDDDEMVSLLLSYTLPFLAARDPMELFHELGLEARGWPDDTMPGHLIRLFDWLRDRFNKAVWVERTGGSLPHTRKMIELWPNAKFVHNYRDCRETAISMETGSFFRLYLELLENPDLDEWNSDILAPIEALGAMLNSWIIDATTALARVPDGQRMNLPYEALISHPRETLLALSGFILDRSEPTKADRAWAERERQTIWQVPLRFPTLPVHDQSELGAACAQGLRILGYA